MPARRRPAPRSGAVGAVLVQADKVLNNSTDRRLGINCDYWWDHQGNRPPGTRDLSAALRDLGVKYLRYPGGEKSDGTVFFGPGDSSPNPRLARISPDDWPSNDPAYWTPPGSRTGAWAHPVYGFDTFMQDCRSIGGEAVVVVALDGIYKSASPGGTSLTRSQAIGNATKLVRYANITKGYRVKYWEIGNEPWLSGYMGGQSNPAVYARDFAEVAAAMKAVDPSIQVGASGSDQTYYEGILATAGDSIDFLTMHPYPTYGLSYPDYQKQTLKVTKELTAAKAALAAYSTHSQRIWFAATETAHLGAPNNLGSAVITAHILGELLKEPALRFIQFWGTRWIASDTLPESNDALDVHNQLTACGRALAIWGSALIGPMLATTSSMARVHAYASRNAAGRVSLVLVNRSSESATVRATVPGRSRAARRQLAGSGAADTKPSYTWMDWLVLSNGVTPRFTLPPVSITFLDLER